MRYIKAVFRVKLAPVVIYGTKCTTKQAIAYCLILQKVNNLGLTHLTKNPSEGSQQSIVDNLMTND